MVNFPITVARVDEGNKGKVISVGKESRRFDLNPDGFEARAVEINSSVRLSLLLLSTHTHDDRYQPSYNSEQ